MAPKSAAHGTGMIRAKQTKAGKPYYEGAIQVGSNADGSRRMYYCTGKTKKVVRDLFARAVEAERQGALRLGPTPTLAEFAAEWLAKLHPPLAANTLADYERNWRLHLAPALGRVRLDRLAPVDVQAFYAKQTARGVGQPTIRRSHALLHRLLRDALRWGYVSRNVADAELVDRPKMARPERRSLTLGEARRFAVAVRGDPLEALYWLAIGCGMRQGEILRLRWADIDWDKPALRVARLAKNESSLRELPLSAPILEVLRRHRKRQLEQRLESGPAWEDGDLVFCDPRGRALDRWHVTEHCYRPLLEKAQLSRLTFHELRHSAATLLLALGVPHHVVAAILGHAQVSTTLEIYAHILPDAKREALDKLGELLTGQS